MFYGLEKAAEAHRHEMLRVAQRERLAHAAAGQRNLRVRQPIGRLLVRLGSRLNDEPRREPQLAGIGDAG